MKKKLIIFLISLIAFMMIFGLGLNEINIILIVIGIVGTLAAGIFLSINLEKYRKERLEKEERDIEILKKLVDQIKLKDNGPDIDEQIRVLKENNIKVDYKNDIY